MTALLRIFAASLICVTLMSLMDGPMREVLRLGCAAFMILAFMLTFRDLMPVLEDWTPEKIDLDLAIEEAQRGAEEVRKKNVSDRLSAYIAQQGRAAGGVCSGTVTYEVEPEGGFRLLRADILWQAGDETAKAILREALSHDFGLPISEIYISEEKT